MSLYINNLNKDEIITSYNFARKSDFVYSEVVSKEQYKELKNEYTEIIEEDEYIPLFKTFKLADDKATKRFERRKKEKEKEDAEKARKKF